MENYVTLQNTWRNLFLGSHLRYILNQIPFYENRIISAFKAPTTLTLKQLNQVALWEELKAHAANKTEIEALYKIWQQIKPLAHMSAKQLLGLLEEEVIPLERHYQQAITAFQKIKTEQQSNGLFPASWFSPSATKFLSQLEENLSNLLKVKSIIYDSLLWRCQAYSLLNEPSHVDDIVAAICHKINSFIVLSTPFMVTTPLSDTLNHDRRLTIYDYLLETAADKDKLYDIVLSPVPKKGHAAFKSAALLKHELKQMAKFQKRVMNKLAQYAHQTNYALFQSFIPKGIRNASQRLWQSISTGLENLGWLPYLLRLHQLRYLAYLGFSFVAYYFLANFLQAPLSLLLGVTAFSLVNTFLFYTIALMPFWILGWHFLVACQHKIYDFFTQRKKAQVYTALDALAKNQEFIANHLSQVVVDISHFDSQHLTQQVSQAKDNLAYIKATLNRYAYGERFFCQGHVNDTINLILVKIDLQEKQLHTHLMLLSQHMAFRVGEDISLLQKIINKPAFTVTISPQQIDNLKQFVHANGEKSVCTTFESNANPLYCWVNKIEQCSHALSASGELKQPWGGWIIRADYLKGWETILRGYLLNSSKQHAALQIHQLIAGNSLATPSQLNNMVGQLSSFEQQPLFLQKIQTLLFKTLKAKTAQQAGLIAKEHKTLIAKWHAENQVQIKEAQNTLTELLKAPPEEEPSLLDSMNDEALGKMYALLDGADIFSYSSNKDDASVKARQQLARVYFERYQGQNSKAIRFLRFFTEEEQTTLLIEVAKKRLLWLLSNMNTLNPSNPFDDTDIELFYDYRLIEAYDKFDFIKIISNSTPFNQPWHQRIETFLDACRRFGLDSGALLEQYQEKNNHFKPSILHQQELNKNKPCTQDVQASAKEYTHRVRF